MPELPKVTWLACKGTIASQAASSLEVLCYSKDLPGGLPNLSGSEILERIPEIPKLVDIVKIIDFTGDYNTATYLGFAKAIKDLDPDMPVVLTHGTNIIPEVAFLLDMTLDRGAPVVITGGMRPISAISTDAKYNLIQAFGLATHPSARNRGVMIAMNDRIGSAYYTTKVSANRIDTFKSHEQGQLGLFNNYTPHFFFKAAKPTYKQYFDVSSIENLPEVAMVYCHTDTKEGVVDKAISEPGVQGLVVAGFGAASFPWNDKLVELGKGGLPIVRTTVHADSHTTPTWFLREQIAAGDLGPAKSKILLQLALVKYGKDVKKIRQAFGTDFESQVLPC